MVTLIGSALENAICQVNVPIGGFTVDPDSGNPYPNTRSYDVHFYFKDGKQPQRQLAESQPKDTPMMWVEGYVTRVVDPLSPSVILPPSIPDTSSNCFPCTIGNLVGSFYPLELYQNAAIKQYVDPSILGEQVWGWFDAN